MKAHVTGGKGFLGRWITAALEGSCEVEVSDVDTLDVTDVEAVTAHFRASPPDVVCHLAGLMGAPASLRDPHRWFAVNCGGTVNVLEACRRAEVRGLVFLSSLTVHGQTEKGEVVDEDSPFRPRHPYAGAKAAAELAVQTYARCYGMRAAVLRPTLIAAEGASEPNAVSDFVAAAERGEPIELFGDGSHRREWLHPSDVAEAVRLAALWAARDEPACETWLVSSGHGVSMADLARKVVAATGKGEVVFTPSNRRAFDLCTATPAKIAADLGWRPAVDVDEIVRRLAAARR